MAARIGGYIRISLDRTGDGDGVARQQEDIQRYGERLGWGEIHWYEDNDLSATNLKRPRPQFEAMLRDVADGNIDVIVAKHLDRLLRRTTELERVMTICEPVGAHIITTAEGVDTSHDGGRLVARILASVAQGEVERKGARQKAAFAQMAERGTGWGVKAFGYTTKSEGDLIIPAEADAIRDGYSMILAGGSLRSIAREWNQRGHLTGQGNPWKGSSVREVLVNTRNCGIRSYRRVPVGPAAWEAIVDQETWEGAVAVLRDPSRNTGADTRSRKYLMAGLARCGCCDSRINSGGAPERRVYVCKREGCHRISRFVHRIDPYITKVMVARLSQPDAIELMTPKARIDETRTLMDQARALREKQESLAIDWADGSLTPGQLRVATKHITERLEEIDGRIYRRSANRIFEGIVGAKDVGAVWEALPLDRKRTIINALCSKVAFVPVGRGSKKRYVEDGVEIHWRTIDDR